MSLPPTSKKGKPAARRRHIAKQIRRRKSLGAKARILAYLQANVNEVVTSEELAYVAGDAIDFGRRTRELRTEEGYAIATLFTGRRDLKPGDYILESTDRVAEPHDRHIPNDVREAVYERDLYACSICNWDYISWTPENRRFLEVHHLHEHARRGPNIVENLVVLCNVCHDDVHAGRAFLHTPNGPASHETISPTALNDTGAGES
jgi:HNH endonuclease